jgi:hypothetical protein
MDQEFGEFLALFPGSSAVTELRARYVELFGEPTGVTNKGWLCKRLAWRSRPPPEADKIRSVNLGIAAHFAFPRKCEIQTDAGYRLKVARGCRSDSRGDQITVS